MAQRGVNKVILVGNLGADPEVRHMPSGAAVANVTLATSESWKDKQTGEQKELTEWHRVVFFGKLAEIVGEYLRKGSQIYVEGKLRTRKWQDQSGQDKYTTEIVVDIGGTMQMLGGKQDSQGHRQQQQQAPQQQQRQPAQQQAQRAQKPAQQGYQEPPMDFDSDIPFAPIGLQYPSILLAC